MTIDEMLFRLNYNCKRVSHGTAPCEFEVIADKLRSMEAKLKLADELAACIESDETTLSQVYGSCAAYRKVGGIG